MGPSIFTILLTTLVITTVNSKSLAEDVELENQIKVIGGGPVPLAVIVSTRFVLTTASCTAGRAANSINVGVGSHALVNPGTVHRSREIITYPGFDPRTKENDISLVNTATVIVISSFVQIIPISRSAIISFNRVLVYGWGLYTPDAVHTVNHMQFLSSTPISNINCTAKHTPLNAARVNDNKICTASEQGQGICFGDQGSPLVGLVESPFQPPIASLIGVASWHTSCADGYPDVYERVAPYFLWTNSYID